MMRFRRRLLDSRGWRCQRCKKPGRLEVHHKTPLEKGGDAFDEQNCEILCKGCHILEHNPHNHEREQWKSMISDLIG